MFFCITGVIRRRALGGKVPLHRGGADCQTTDQRANVQLRRSGATLSGSAQSMEGCGWLHCEEEERGGGCNFRTEQVWCLYGIRCMSELDPCFVVKFHSILDAL